jgi:hypothetical protein
LFQLVVQQGFIFVFSFVFKIFLLLLLLILLLLIIIIIDCFYYYYWLLLLIIIDYWLLLLLLLLLLLYCHIYLSYIHWYVSVWRIVQGYPSPFHGITNLIESNGIYSIHITCMLHVRPIISEYTYGLRDAYKTFSCWNVTVLRQLVWLDHMFSWKFKAKKIIIFSILKSERPASMGKLMQLF